MSTTEKIKTVRDVLEKYAGREKSQLIPILQDIQEMQGYISRESVREVSEWLDLPASHIYGVSTFYNQFRLTPPGKHLIQVCRGTACHVKGSAKLLTALEHELGIKTGQTTRDQNFTLETVACLGACSIAPVVCIDGNFHGRVEISKLSEILDLYREKAGVQE